MKLIKKIAAIMFAFMMVFSLSTNVKAESGTSTNTKGSITITNAIKGQDYRIYKILNLESFNSEKGKEAYSYTIAHGWENFFSADGKGSSYVNLKNGYVTWNDGADAANLAKEAITYAKDDKNGVTAVDVIPTKVNIDDRTEKLTYSNLELGYYLVDSSVGVLCGLTTTNPNPQIHEKNGVPNVEKHVTVNREPYATENYANIGDVLTFQTVIHVKKGAQNYVLHDTMGTGLLLKDNVNEGSLISTVSVLQVYAQGDEGPEGAFHELLNEGTDYKVTKDTTSFTATFSDKYLKKYENYNYTMNVTYRATLTKDAKISSSDTLVPNTNKTYLTYGDNKTSNEAVTQTYTCGIPVFKYTTKFTGETGLAGAEFKLYEEDETTEIKLIKTDNTTKATYRKFMTGDDDAKKATIKTDESGQFDITGLKLGTYYLAETKAPDGYNILTSKIKVVIKKDADGKPAIYVNNDDINKQETVKVLNEAGSLLPSTGGMGTTLIYLVANYIKFK
jgi:hypothetical protein